MLSKKKNNAQDGYIPKLLEKLFWYIRYFCAFAFCKKARKCRASPVEYRDACIEDYTYLDCTSNQRSNQDGYSLVELSISLTIIALLLTGGLAVLSKTSDAKRYRLTYSRMAAIEAALGSFVDTNRFLPCPAAGSSIETNILFGVASGYDPVTHSCNLVTAAGMVPVRSLNIDDSFAYDGWGRKFTYRVATGLGEVRDFSDTRYRGDLRITDISGNEKTTIDRVPPGNMGAAYVIISNGANGNATHSAIAPSDTTQSSREEENRNHLLNQVYIQNEPMVVFDDILIYKKKNDLVSIAIAKSPINIPDHVCGNATALVAPDALIPLQTDAPVLARRIYEASRAVLALCANPPALCSLNPLSVGAPGNLALWLDASDPGNTGTTPGAFSAQKWKDKSAAHNDAAGDESTFPGYVANALGNKPVMRFNGSQSLSFSLERIQNSSYSIFIVEKRASYSANPAYLLSGSPGFNMGYNNDTSFALFHSSGDSVITMPILKSAAPVTTVTSVIFDVNSLGKSVRSLVNGVVYSGGFSGNKTALTAITGGTIGKGTDSNTSYRGDIAEIVIYNKALSTNERAAVEGYLIRKWVSGECP